MPRILTQVRQAGVADAPRMLRLLDRALRQYTSFGNEDLGYLLAQNRVWLADAADTLRGFLCVTPRFSSVADLRGLALINGWRVDTGVRTLLVPVMRDLKEQGTAALVCLGAAPWLVPTLQRAGFNLVDRIVYLERPTAPTPPPQKPQAVLRPICGGDLSALLTLDSAAFDPLWRFDRGHFMELLVTTGHSTIAEKAEQPVGYAVSDVVGETGFIVRLAVHPDFQGWGIGSQLLADSLDYCRAAGAATVRLNTQESNVASHHLYQRFDFQRAGRRVPVLVREL
mgnify:CR=1 FL=1